MLSDLKEYSKSVYSQYGEDGVLLEIFKLLKKEVPLNEYCVEFGTLDGIKFSNTANLIFNHQWSALLIEGDYISYKNLRKNYINADRVKLLNRYVEFTGANKLDNILIENDVPNDFDFLSIDVDGYDYQIWESLNESHPKIVCIEYNPTIPIGIDYVNPIGINFHGSSITSINQLASKKGYKLLFVNENNMIFIKSDLFKFVSKSDVNVSDFSEYVSPLTAVFTSSNGFLIYTQPTISFNWHVGKIESSRIQFIPKYFRYHMGEYSVLKKFLYRIYYAIVNKRSVFGLLKRKD